MALIKIGGVEVDSPIWLAPLAGVTTPSLRLFHRKLGAALVHTEMVSALGLVHGGEKTKNYLFFSEAERPIALQLFGPDAHSLAEGARIALSLHSYEALQVNMACPMPKVTKKGSGSKMLEKPDEAVKVVQQLCAFGIPVWVKIRILPKNHSMTTTEFCEQLFAAGADLVFIHGRTPAQRYEGVADRGAVCRIASYFPEKIVGSGDYYKPEDAVEMLSGGCAAVIAARGVLRDVLLIPKTLHVLGYPVDERLLSLGMKQQIEMLTEMGDSAVQCEGEQIALVLVRRMLSGMLKGFQGAASLRQCCSQLKEWEQMRSELLKVAAMHP